MFAFTEEEMTKLVAESGKLDDLYERLHKEMKLIDEYPEMEERYLIMDEVKDQITEQNKLLAGMVADFVRAHKE